MKYLLAIFALIIITSCSTAPIPIPEIAVVTATAVPTEIQSIPQVITNPFEMKAEDVARIMNDEHGYSFEWVEGDGFSTEVGGYNLIIEVPEGGQRTDKVSSLVLEFEWLSGPHFQSSAAGLLLYRLEMGRFSSEFEKRYEEVKYKDTNFSREYIGDYEVEIQRYISDDVVKIWITPD